MTRRIIVVTPSVQPPGGGSGVGAWTVQAFQDTDDVTLLSWEPLRIDVVNRFFGTSLKAARIVNHTPPAWLRWLVEQSPIRPLSTLKLTLLLLHYRWLYRTHPYDITISTCGEIDFHRRGIQYIHFPEPPDSLEYISPVWQRNPVLRSLLVAYRLGLRWLSGNTLRGMERNLTLANSHYTATYVQKVLGMNAQVVYPPAVGNDLDVPWSTRRNGFLCLGRVAPTKRLETIVAILERVRHQHAIQLHIIGNPDFPDYYQAIRRLCQPHQDWISFHDGPSRSELDDLMAANRYGIHGMLGEHFGMAVAEMVRAGCVVFVPNVGGQVEVVAKDERLTYADEDDAVRKITAVLDSPELQQTLRSVLEPQRQAFTPERFLHEMREAVEQL